MPERVVDVLEVVEVEEQDRDRSLRAARPLESDVELPLEERAIGQPRQRVEVRQELDALAREDAVGVVVQGGDQKRPAPTLRPGLHLSAQMRDGAFLVHDPVVEGARLAQDLRFHHGLTQRLAIVGMHARQQIVQACRGSPGALP